MKSVKQIQRELLGKYYKLEGDIATVELQFDTFEELVDKNFGDNKVEKLNSQLIDKIEEAFQLIPRKYKLKVLVGIKDFGEYNQEESIKIIEDNIHLKIYELVHENNRKRITAVGMLAIGIAMLFLSYFLSSVEMPQIVFDIINISGTLFVWESASLTFLERNDNRKIVGQFIKKITKLEVVKLAK